MENVTLGQQTVQSILDYLVEQKFKDVYNLIQLIQRDLSNQKQTTNKDEKSEEF